MDKAKFTERRSTDVCKAKLEIFEKQQKEMQKDVSVIKQRIFNGFGTAIESTQKSLVMAEENNLREHDIINKSLSKLETKIDRMMWLIVSAFVVAMITSVCTKLFGG